MVQSIKQSSVSRLYDIIRSKYDMKVTFGVFVCFRLGALPDRALSAASCARGVWFMEPDQPLFCVGCS